jgi:hypothetical protein
MINNQLLNELCFIIKLNILLYCSIVIAVLFAVCIELEVRSVLR